MRHIAHAGCFGWVFRVFARKHLPVWGDNFLAADARLFDVVARGSIAGDGFPGWRRIPDERSNSRFTSGHCFHPPFRIVRYEHQVILAKR